MVSMIVWKKWQWGEVSHSIQLSFPQLSTYTSTTELAPVCPEDGKDGTWLVSNWMPSQPEVVFWLTSMKPDPNESEGGPLNREISQTLRRGECESQGWAGMTFGHLGTGTGMINCIPIFWEREREWQFHSQFLGTGTGMENQFPNFGNGNETLLFPGMTGNGNGNGIAKFSEIPLFHVSTIPYNWYCGENHDKGR